MIAYANHWAKQIQSSTVTYSKILPANKWTNGQSFLVTNALLHIDELSTWLYFREGPLSSASWTIPWELLVCRVVWILKVQLSNVFGQCGCLFPCAWLRQSCLSQVCAALPQGSWCWNPMKQQSQEHQHQMQMDEICFLTQCLVAGGIPVKSQFFPGENILRYAAFKCASVYLGFGLTTLPALVVTGSGAGTALAPSSTVSVDPIASISCVSKDSFKQSTGRWFLMVLGTCWEDWDSFAD